MSNSLEGRQVHVFTGSGYQVCTIRTGVGSKLPFRAQSQRNGFYVSFGASVAQKLRKGTAPNMKLI